jgi:hypothetical protein
MMRMDLPMLKQLANLPLIRWMGRHPRLAAWIVLSVGMVILLLIEAREVGLLPGQWLALIAATVLVAGACVWIISWEDEDEVDEAAPVEPPADPAQK